MTAIASTCPAWEFSVLHRDMPDIKANNSLALIWAISALSIIREAEQSDLMAGNLMLIDRRQHFDCVGASDTWSARMLDFGGRDLERKVGRSTMILWQPLDGRSAMVSAIRNIWLSIQDFRKSGQHVSEYRAMDLLAQTVATLVSGANDAGASRYATALLARAKAIIRTDLSDPDLTVQIVADRLGLSSRRVAAIFSAEHTTPTAFITAERMNAAETMLADPLNPNRRIESIAWTCGYRNHNHFCRVFKARYGISPSTYRHRIQQD